MRTEENKTTDLWKLYENGIKYLENTKLASSIPIQRAFYEGKQWEAPTDNTAMLPRPVFNITRMITKNKISNILGTPVKLKHDTYKKKVDTKKFSNFYDYISKEMRLAEYDSRAIRDGAVEGSYCYHFYWDKQSLGLKGTQDGAVRVEILNPLNVLFANPNEVDEQKQQWIMIVSRHEVESIKAVADSGVDKDLIVPDESESKYKEKEQEGNKYVTVLTRYFRQDGEVFVEKATKTVVVNKARSITPDDEKFIKGKKEDTANVSLPDTNEVEPYTKEKFSVYPIVWGVWEERKNSIYGISEVEGLIPNQKAINFNIALQLLESQSSMKYVVSPDALKGQQISTEPFEVLVNYSRNPDGIKRLSQNQLSNVPMAISNLMLELTRVVTGSTEVMTGEVTGANSSGVYVQSLQAQALKPIEELQQRFWRVKEKQGKVLEYFQKFYYENTDFYYKEFVDDKESIATGTFNGSEFRNVKFDIVAVAGRGSKWSEIADIQALELLFQKGAIDLEIFLEAYPDSALSNKDKILEAIRRRRESENAILKEKLEEADKVMKEATELIEEQNKSIMNVRSIILDNKRLNEELAALKADSIETFGRKEEQLQQTKQDAQFLASELQATINENKQMIETEQDNIDELFAT